MVTDARFKPISTFLHYSKWTLYVRRGFARSSSEINGKKSRPSKEKKAAGAKNAAAMKKAGKGIVAPKTLSPALAAICGKKVMPRTEVTKQIWVYIKKL
mgnify:CR=1 FL=1